MGGDDERSARRERRDQPGRREEVRVDDIWAEPSRRPSGVEREAEVAQLPARAAVDDGPLELVAARGELSFQVGDEDPEVRIVRARVHLRDEEDPHVARQS